MSEKLLYTKEHEWVLVKGSVVRVGISDYAQNELGDIVFVDLPSVGDVVEEGEGFAVLESVKAVSDVYAPVSGRIVAVNEALEDSPELINESPLDKGWIAEIELDDAAQVGDLMNEQEYAEYLKGV
ncbi:MAG: glycine cleavage system protein GcvH [Limnochordia bacterium]|jgi:glycine cleavage system H protein|nr:glycine cleavage system protein GcvH [Limnochordia bacterium]MDI9466085.1 glycine cleavage system protein GcvH [Bacillota bacterium]NLO96399.1 glycine cleavage system protein GcvH [Bacillota bacterium]HAI52003.1 glycine cleavage system protein GcvH [Bacillota bacterium]HAN94503.1 glycine cleavage system protein GcvH [Bacillota bacterium]